MQNFDDLPLKKDIKLLWCHCKINHIVQIEFTCSFNIALMSGKTDIVKEKSFHGQNVERLNIFATFVTINLAISNHGKYKVILKLKVFLMWIVSVVLYSYTTNILIFCQISADVFYMSLSKIQNESVRFIVCTVTTLKPKEDHHKKGSIECWITHKYILYIGITMCYCVRH